MGKTMILLLALLCADLSFAQRQPLACQVDASSGLVWEGGKWRAGWFAPQKFILVRDGSTFTKESVASAFHTRHSQDIVCFNTFNPKVICLGVAGGKTIYFDLSTLRGGISTIFGSTQADNEIKDTVSVDAFTCQPF